jgi:uncharacterized membrane protein YbaN (DUF454 family)
MPATPLPDPADQPMRVLPRPVRWLLKLLAVVSLALGIVGAFLPVLPTVPFVLLAAWAAARSSPRMTRWLEQHPTMGPHITAWRHGGRVRRSAKWMATLTMSAGALVMFLFVRPLWVPLLATTTMTCVAIWLWLRPEGPGG